MHGQRWNIPNPATKAISARRDLVAAAPSCALTCIQEFAESNYSQNTCPFTSSITFLCTSRTSSGLTIGEGSIQCLVSRCTGNDLLRVGVYNVCDNVPGAVAKTLSVITATLQPATTINTSMATPLPSTIGVPSATKAVTSIVMASGVPKIPAPAPTPSSTTDLATTSPAASETSRSSVTSTPRRPDPTSSPVAASDQASPFSRLSTAQISAIGVGAGLITLILIALFYYLYRRRQKVQRRRSVRWSMHGASMPPPNRGAIPRLPVTTKALDDGSLSPLGSSQRYYASSPPGEKRRSFWRRSIKPEDIGVAVSAHARNSSPTSFSSQQSIAKLLPQTPDKLPTRAVKALWPAPLDLSCPRKRQSNNLRPTSELTVFDEDLEANATPPPPRQPEARNSHSLMFPSKDRRNKVLPAPLQLNTVTHQNFSLVSREVDQSSSAHIPLTPTYDNGNVVNSFPRMYPPSSWRQSRQPEELSSPPQSALPDDMSPTRNAQLSKNLLGKKPSMRTATKSDRKEVAAPAAALKPVPKREDSETTAGTEIEEDTSPEEFDRRLEIVERLKPSPMLTSRAFEGTEGPRSPISNLRYPSIPRSAAVSPEAELVAQPLKNLEVPTFLNQRAPARPTRDQLVRNESSFMVTDTTSSDGYLSDHSIEWPVPPSSRGSQSAVKTGMARLRENPSSGNRGGRNRPGPSMNEILQLGSRSSFSQALPTTSTVKAEITPKGSNGGDLFFKVEM
jgi:hypothetical protein